LFFGGAFLEFECGQSGDVFKMFKGSKSFLNIDRCLWQDHARPVLSYCPMLRTDDYNTRCGFLASDTMEKNFSIRKPVAEAGWRFQVVDCIVVL